jgi:peptide/nickel transport system permease protein
MTVIGITLAIGVTIGAISGYLGGITDEIIMRIVDVLLTFPGLILALAIIAALGPGLFNAGIALVVVGWAGYTRIVRGSVLSVKRLSNNYQTINRYYTLVSQQFNFGIINNPKIP